jgi:hypothetical protein
MGGNEFYLWTGNRSVAAWATTCGLWQFQGRRWLGLTLPLGRCRGEPSRLGHETYIRETFSILGPSRESLIGFFEHTCFCAIDPDRRGDYVRRVTTLLKPGGHLLAIFFLDPDNDEDGPPYGCSLKSWTPCFRPAFGLSASAASYPHIQAGREENSCASLFGSEWRPRLLS